MLPDPLPCHINSPPWQKPQVTKPSVHLDYLARRLSLAGRLLCGYGRGRGLRYRCLQQLSLFSKPRRLGFPGMPLRFQQQLGFSIRPLDLFPVDASCFQGRLLWSDGEQSADLKKCSQQIKA
jgi:hypothetical protein